MCRAHCQTLTAKAAIRKTVSVHSAAVLPFSQTNAEHDQGEGWRDVIADCHDPVMDEQAPERLPLDHVCRGKIMPATSDPLPTKGSARRSGKAVDGEDGNGDAERQQCGEPSDEAAAECRRNRRRCQAES